MEKYLIWVLLIVFFMPLMTYSQKAAIFVKLIDSTSDNASDYIFNVEVKNIGFNKYWVQDTSILAKFLENPAENLIHPYLERRVGSFKL
jgi:hypothetical protein